MFEDLAFLWMTELTFNCIGMVSENCFTSVSRGVWHRWTCIPAQDDCTAHHSSSAFLGFASETVFLMSPHKFSVGLRSGDWAARLLACLGLLSCWKGHFLFGMRQYKLKYFNVLQLIHVPWNAINRPNINIRNIPISWCLHHHASRSSLCTVAWIQCLWVVGQTVCLSVLTKKEESCFISPQNIAPFLFSPVNVFFGKF